MKLGYSLLHAAYSVLFDEVEREIAHGMSVTAERELDLLLMKARAAVERVDPKAFREAEANVRLFLRQEIIRLLREDRAIREPITLC